jgi:hypothetical protein
VFRFPLGQHIPPSMISPIIDLTGSDSDSDIEVEGGGDTDDFMFVD